MADETSPVAVARQKFACPACGGEVHWHPGTQALVCPFCGTTSQAPDVGVDDKQIKEHDLVAALQSVPATARGWQVERTSVRCQSCQAITVFDPSRVSQRCDFCGSTALVPYEQVNDVLRPESVLPMSVTESRARELIRQWYGRQWLAPNAFSGRALTDTVKGLYLPYWTFDAKVQARWTAESGTHYWARENGRQVQRTRWTPASGLLSHAFDDDLVCASKGVDETRLRQIEPFPTGALRPYDPRFLSGWTVERYQIDLIAAASRSRARMEASLRDLCGRQVPGDTFRNLVVHPTFTDQTFKHTLVPVWLLSYTYGARTYQVVVNGVTGRLAGSRPWSAIKVALLVIAAVAAIAVVASVGR